MNTKPTALNAYLAHAAALSPPVLESRQEGPLSSGRDSESFGFLHPRRDVALAVQYAPDINVL